MAEFPPVPRWSQVLQTRLDGKQQNAIGKSWDDWFQAIWNAISDTSLQLGRVSIAAQSATVAPTNVATGLAAGLYRLSYYAQITQAASVSSSLTPGFQWTYNGVAQSLTVAALTSNVLTAHQELCFPIRVDQSSDVTYSATYASSGLPVMTYSLDVALEAVPA